LVDMKLGAVFPQLEIGTDPETIARYARELERMGYDHLVVYDHVLGADPERPGGWTGPYTFRSQFHEPFVLFGYLAAITTTLELATAVIILPQRQTALVAKQAAEVDVLTGGRLRLGVGIGWNSVEYEALGVDFHTRGSRIEEQIRLMRALWCDEVVDLTGKWHRVDRAGLNPMPVQRPIPIWMGGGYKSNVSQTERAEGVVDRALERIAKLADGWFTHVQPGDEGAAAMQRFRELVRSAGRDPASVGVEGRVNAFRVPAEEWPREIDWWRRMGATHIELNTMNAKYASLDDHLDALRRFAEMVRGPVSVPEPR
jgi:probable F420-dependent oxidoreductase